MAATLTLAQIAKGERVTYQTAARWAKRYRWPIRRPANRTLGRPAQYDYEAVQRTLGKRDLRREAAA